MHILLNGIPGIGKSTAICKVVEELRKKNIPVKGFFTKEIRDEKNERVGFDLVSIPCGQTAPLARTKLWTSESRDLNIKQYFNAYHPLIRSTKFLGRYIVYNQILEKFTIPLVDIKDEHAVIIIDEIGKMESFSKKLFEKISHLLCYENIIIIATANSKGAQLDLVDTCKNHSKFETMTITTQNRGEIPDKILQSVQSNIKNVCNVINVM